MESIRLSSPATDSLSHWSSWSRWHRCRFGSLWTCQSDCRRPTRWPRTTSCPRALPTSASTRPQRRRRCWSGAPMAACSSRYGRRYRRRRHRTWQWPARACRSGRGARRPASDLESRRRRHVGESGDAVRAVIAEDSVLLREGVAGLLRGADIDVVGCCETAHDLLLKVRSYSPDVAIIDIRLPPTHQDEGLKAALEYPLLAPRCRRAGAVAVPRAGPGAEALRRLGGWRRIPPEGQDQRRRRVPRRRPPDRPREARRSTP